MSLKSHISRLKSKIKTDERDESQISYLKSKI